VLIKLEYTPKLGIHVGGHGLMVEVGSVLHICGDYANQKLYPELMISLKEVGVTQSVYVPVRTVKETMVPGPSSIEIRYHVSHVLQWYHRILYHLKINSIKKDILLHENPKKFSIVHAHSLYSDGGVAYRLYQQFSIPYIVAVRNTDFNAFMRLRPDLNSFMYRIATSASAIIFLSPAYCVQFLQQLPSRVRAIVESRSKVIPNGIYSDWFVPDYQRIPASEKLLKVLYVGDFSPNKNVIRLLEACQRIVKTRALKLTLVGGGGSSAAAIKELLVQDHFQFAQYIGRVVDRKKLSELYRSHDILAMPSLKETFGLVYIEALSQGTSILHSEGQGVDGYFPKNTIAESVNPLSVDDIVRGISVLSERAKDQYDDCITAARQFLWPNIAQTYKDVYGDSRNVQEK